MQAFQQEISLNNNKIEQIIVQGEQLIEKSEPIDAAVIEEELDELRRYCQEVFGRVERYHKKLIRLPVCILTYMCICLVCCHFASERMRTEEDGEMNMELTKILWFNFVTSMTICLSSFYAVCVLPRVKTHQIWNFCKPS